jgi:hypothetical protein
MKLLSLIILLAFLISSCNLEDQILEKPEVKNQISKFDKENVIAQFNYNIGLIELHKKRFGEYPLSLDSLKHLNYWDVPNRFEYKKLPNGYVLNAINDTIAKMTATDLDIADINLPDSFWKGIGLVESNLKSKN